MESFPYKFIIHIQDLVITKYGGHVADILQIPDKCKIDFALNAEISIVFNVIYTENKEKNDVSIFLQRHKSDSISSKVH